MQDTITKTKAEQKKHEEEIASQLKQNKAVVEELKFVIDNQQAKVENFESYLDKNKMLIE